MPAALVIVTGILVITIAYGWTEAGWLRERVLEVPARWVAEKRSTAFGSHISPTSTSGAPLSRGNRARASVPRGGSRSGDPTSSVSPETSCPTRVASLVYVHCSRLSTTRSSCSATMTSP